MTEKKIIPDSKDEKRLLVWSIIIAGSILLLDQITKAIVEKQITENIEVVPGFFSLVIVANSGAAWGMFSGQRWLLLAISILFFLGVIFFFRSITEGWRERFYAIALVLGGILGNSVDRIWRGGFVVDFLDFYIGDKHWPAFNVADSAICIGVGILVLSSWLRTDNKKDGETNIKSSEKQRGQEKKVK